MLVNEVAPKTSKYPSTWRCLSPQDQALRVGLWTGTDGEVSVMCFSHFSVTAGGRLQKWDSSFQSRHLCRARSLTLGGGFVSGAGHSAFGTLSRNSSPETLFEVECNESNVSASCSADSENKVVPLDNEENHSNIY